METRETLRVLLIIVSLAFRIEWKLLSQFVLNKKSLETPSPSKWCTNIVTKCWW